VAFTSDVFYLMMIIYILISAGTIFDRVMRVERAASATCEGACRGGCDGLP